MRSLRKRKVVKVREDEENQRVPELILHSTLEGTAVGKTSFVNGLTPERLARPSEDWDFGDYSHILPLKNAPVKAKKRLVQPLNLKMWTDEMNKISLDHRSVSVQKRERKLFTLVDACKMICPIDDDDGVIHSSCKGDTTPKNTSDLKFDELLKSFETNGDEEKCEPSKSSPKRTRKVRAKKRALSTSDSDAPKIASKHGKRKSQVRRKKTIKRDSETSDTCNDVGNIVTPNETFSLGGRNVSVPGVSPHPVKVLQQLIFCPDQYNMDVSKRLSIIQEASPEVSPGVLQVAESDKENLDTNSPFEVVYKKLVQQLMEGSKDPAKLIFLKELEVMRSNLLCLGRLARIYDYEEIFKLMLQNAKIPTNEL